MMKDDLRRDAILTRASTINRDVAAQKAASNLVRLVGRLQCSAVALYAATSDELGTLTADRILRLAGSTVVYPKCWGDGLIFCPSERDSLDLCNGIPEPPSVNPVNAIDLVVVPGLAFDKQGYRLGWGAGYYDRALAYMDAWRVGFAFSNQVVQSLPRDDHDVPMDYVVTESRISCIRT